MARWVYSGLVVLFWLASMTWLVTDRILPAFMHQDAPLALPARQDEPIGWRIQVNGQPLGMAVMQAVSRKRRVTEVHSLVQLDRFRPPEVASSWLTPTLAALNGLRLSLRSTLTYDSLNELASFRAQLGMGQLDSPIRLSGRVDKQRLQMTARYGETVRRIEHHWPSGARVANEISPAARLLPLYEGRRWTQEVLNPLASPQSPIELIEGRVVEQLRLDYHGESVRGWRVEYRALNATGSSEESRLRAAMFVDLRGNILEQEIYLLGVQLKLIRVDQETSQELAEEHLQLFRDKPEDEKPPAA